MSERVRAVLLWLARLCGLAGPASVLSRVARVAVTLIVLLVAARGARALLGGAGAPKGSDPVRVRREDLVMTVEVTGELAAVRATDIGPPPVKDLWDYKISFLAAESQPVRKGQPVIGFDTQPLQKSLEEKSAEFQEASKQIERKEIDLAMQLHAQELTLAEDQAKLDKARLKSDVPQELRGRIEALQAKLDLADAEEAVSNDKARLTATKTTGEADLRALRSRRDRAKGRLDDLKTAIDAMTVKAPQDGIIIYKTGWRDEKKKIGDSAWVGEKVLELPDLSEMKADGMVDEADAGQVAVGQKVTIRLDAHPDIDFSGRVKSIGQTVRRQSWRVPTKVYRIEVSLDRTDSAAMRPAMRFRGDVETARIPNVLVAPREAIFLRPTGPVAWQRRSGRWRETPVKLGRSNKRFVEILEGLDEGDQISPTDLKPPEPRATRGPMTAGL